jgi:hypothetical protein
MDRKHFQQQFRDKVIFIDPEAETIEVFVLKNPGYQVHFRAEPGEMALSKLLGGFSVKLDQLTLEAISCAVGSS